MGVIVGVFVFLIALGAVIRIVGKCSHGASSRLLRPYIGLLLIAGVIAGMGMVLGTMFRGVEDYFFIVAKGVAVFTGVVLCLKLIIAIAKRFFAAD